MSLEFETPHPGAQTSQATDRQTDGRNYYDNSRTWRSATFS